MILVIIRWNFFVILMFLLFSRGDYFCRYGGLFKMEGGYLGERFIFLFCFLVMFIVNKLNLFKKLWLLIVNKGIDYFVFVLG